MRTAAKWLIVMVGVIACERSAPVSRRPATHDTTTPIGQKSSAAHPPASAEKRTILFVGTSLTAGYGLDPDQAYPALIQQRLDSLRLNYVVVNAGVSGETSAGARRRINWLMRGPVDLFILETGANDGLRGLNVDSLRANIQAIFAAVRTAHPNARLVLAGMEAPPNLGARYTSAFHAVYPDLARQNHASLIPFLLAGVAGVDTLNQADGIHPNERGERVVAENVWKMVEPMVPPLDHSRKTS